MKLYIHFQKVPYLFQKYCITFINIPFINCLCNSRYVYVIVILIVSQFFIIYYKFLINMKNMIIYKRLLKSSLIIDSKEFDRKIEVFI